MKFMILTLAIISVVFAAPPASKPQQKSPEVELINQYQDIKPDGSYEYQFSLTDGTEVEQSGDPENNVHGSFKYESPEGIPVFQQYTADENGIKVTGSHIPVPPETPEYVIRLLKYLAEFAVPAEIEKEQQKTAPTQIKAPPKFTFNRQ